MGITLVFIVISCPDPSTVPDAVSLSNPSSSVEEEAESIVPYPWKVSLAFLFSRSYIDKYISDGVVRITMSSDEEGASTSGPIGVP